MGGVAGPRLAAAVSSAGAGGVLGLYKLSVPRVTEVVEATAASTTAPFGINVIPEVVGAQTAHQQVEMAVKALPDNGFVTFFGLPDVPTIRAARAVGHPVVVQVGTVTDADRAVNLGTDVVVLQGTEAGGHLLGNSSRDELLRRVRARHPRAVLAVAGGIATPADLQRARAGGADGALAGTLFVPTEESDAHPLFKRRVLEASADSTTVTSVFDIGWPGRRHRVLANATTRAKHRHRASFIAITTVDGRRLPVARYSAATPSVLTQGAIDEMALYCGESCDRVTEAASVQAVLARFDQNPQGDSMIEHVTDWLKERTGRTEAIPPDLDLIETRLLDSLSFMEFILLLEDVMGREIDPEKLSVDQFRTLNAIQENFFDQV